MDLTKVLAHLRAELESLDAAIASLDRLQQGDRRRGRPLLSLQAVKPTKRGKSKAKQGSLHAEFPPTEGT
jgi:hypothetical protein